jgi:hypothetical protein
VKKILIISVAVHFVLLAALSPWLVTRMTFSKAAEAQRTDEVKKRELARKEHDRLKREKVRLDPKTAELLKRESEKERRKEMIRELSKLRKLRDEIFEKRDRELERIRQRTAKDIVLQEKSRIGRLSQRLLEKTVDVRKAASHTDTSLARCSNDRKHTLNGFLDDLSIYPKVLDPQLLSDFRGNIAGASHRWNFEKDLVDEVTGVAGELRKGGRLVLDAERGGTVFAADGKDSQGLLGQVDYGDRFTIMLWVRAEPSKHLQILIANTLDAGIKQNGFRLFLTASEGSSTRVEFASGEGRDITRSTADSFPYGEWTHVAVTLDKELATARIYINGRDATEAGGRVDKNVYTGAVPVEDIHAGALQLQAKLATAEALEANREKLIEEIEAYGKKVDEKLAQADKNEKVRDALTDTRRRVEEVAKAIQELTPMTEMTAMNDTSAAHAGDPPPAGDADGDAAEAYQQAARIEKEIADAKADIDAAAQAASTNSSYAEARAGISSATPPRPDLGESLQGINPETVGGLNEFREALGQASRQMQDMAARGEAALGGNRESAASAASFASQAIRGMAASMDSGHGTVVDMTSFVGGGGDSGDMRKDTTSEGGEMAFAPATTKLSVNQENILSVAMPGRRFTRDSTRRGWLYLDTWYVIGPWENRSTVDFGITRPPEFGIDFDAVYRDGKFSKRPDHPDHLLKWQFYQSDQVRNQPPRVYAASTYYAYTDVWFDQERDMLIAIASDDAASVWLNGEVIWQDTGQSAWQLGEGYRRVHFRKGFNDILVRIENGPSHCVWSVVLCPPEVLGNQAE